MKQVLLPANASFVAATGIITFSNTIPIDISHILHVTNVTRGVLYFQPQAGLAYSGTFASPSLTLNASTVGHANGDQLFIVYDDGISEATLLGAINETAPATDTDPSGQNGRLQRIAQRITTLLGRIPAALGITTSANALCVAPASDSTFATAPTLGAAAGVSIVASTALEASRVIKASPGTLLSLVGYNSKTSTQFIQVHDVTTVVANGAVPIYSWPVPAATPFSLNIAITGAPFLTGIMVCNSSTQPTKTIGAADCWFTALIK